MKVENKNAHRAADKHYFFATHVRDGDGTDRTYPILSSEAISGFRAEAHRELHAVIRSTFPSLAETEKPELSDD